MHFFEECFMCRFIICGLLFFAVAGLCRASLIEIDFSGDFNSVNFTP